MSTIEKNKETVRSLYDEILNKRKMELLPGIISNGYTGIRGQKGATAFAEPVTALIAAFPDIEWKIEELIGDGDKIVVKWKWVGTHIGQFQQFIPTGNPVSNDGMGIYELKDGIITNVHVQTDRLGFLQQVGAVASDPSLLSNKRNSKNIRKYNFEYFTNLSSIFIFLISLSLNPVMLYLRNQSRLLIVLNCH